MDVSPTLYQDFRLLSILLYCHRRLPGRSRGVHYKFPFRSAPSGIAVGAIGDRLSGVKLHHDREQEGRFFHLWEGDVAVGSTPLAVWGIANDPAGQTLDTFVIAQLNGYCGTQNPCFEPMSPLETTMTATQ